MLLQSLCLRTNLKILISLISISDIDKNLTNPALQKRMSQ